MRDTLLEVGSALARRGRLVVKGVAAVAATFIGQTAILAATYSSPPDAKGPTAGTVQYLDSSSPSDNAGQSCNAGHPGLSALTGMATTRHDNSASPSKRPPEVALLILGDSLVTGVGCDMHEAGGTEGPSMPKRLAESLAQQLRRDVSWKAVGQTGATVAQIREHCVPQLREHVNLGKRVDAVLFFCGVNDFKRLLNPQSGASASNFKQELEQTVWEIREILGPECYIAFPQLPIEAVDRFYGPLGVAVRYISNIWDEQKREVAHSLGDRGIFIDKPQLKGLGAFKFTSAADGVHPSSQGYSVWGEHCGSVLAPYMR